jgi:hypothetical protein
MFSTFMMYNLLASAMILQNCMFCDCKSFYALDTINEIRLIFPKKKKNQTESTNA